LADDAADADDVDPSAPEDEPPPADDDDEDDELASCPDPDGVGHPARTTTTKAAHNPVFALKMCPPSLRGRVGRYFAGLRRIHARASARAASHAGFPARKQAFHACGLASSTSLANVV
jgi:hypothetical protein